MKLTRLTLLISAAVLLAIGLAGCAGSGSKKEAKKGVEYYRTLQFSETPFDLERGAHQITPEQARTINSYKFTYDDQGRLSSVEYVRNDSLLDYGSLGGAAKIAYEYTGNRQIKKFFNTRNEQIETQGYYTAVYTLDDNGVRNGLMFHSKDGKMVENRNGIHSYTWNMLPDGMVRELRYNLAGEETVMNPFCPFYELRFTYNDDGYVTRMANYMEDTLYNCTAENCGDIGVSYFVFTPNQYGDIEKFEVFNVFGQMSNLYWGWSKRVSKFDENGYVLETAYFDQDDEYLAGKNVPVTQYKYDEHGALVETVNMDKDRNIINHPDTGVAITEYKYDDTGNRVETLSYNKDKVALAR